jgi:sporulation protein YlmC with PRC-barrel domain
MNLPIEKKLISGIIFTTFATAQVFAADTMKSSEMHPRATSAAANSHMTSNQAHTMRDMRASKLIGSDVRNAQNENLGEIKDLIIDVNNSRVYYAIVSFGGFLGMGDKLFAFPVNAFRQVANEDKVIINLDKERLKKAPGFNSKEFPDFNAPTYRTEVDSYFGPDAAIKPMANQVLRRASEWIGKDINDRNGKDVGEVSDLVVNMGNGNIHYAVVEFDKSWSMKDKLLAVPMQALRYTNNSKDLTWDIDKSRLDTKGAFDKNKWPDINQSKTTNEFDRMLAIQVPPSANNNAMTADEKNK